MDPFALVIFGVTSNLAKLKLIPALYDLEEKNLLPEKSRIIGIARRPFSKIEFHKYITGILNSENRHHQHSTEKSVLIKLLNKIEYLQGDFDGEKGVLYENLKDKLQRSGYEYANHIYYLATYPDLYAAIFRSLKKNGLSQKNRGWVRLMVEKPIGNDLRSYKILDKLLHLYFSEEQIYRLDHYLGKETIQNILVFRFGNGLMQPLMNREHVDHIQITAAENFGIGERGGYFDSMGTLKDVGQNHLLQMLVVATMEPPAEFSNRAVTDARIAILQKLVADPQKIVLGQYNGYLYEKKVDPNSIKDTFFALKTQINSDRWKGVPIYIRAGKKLAQTVTEISIVFKVPGSRMFHHQELGNRPNILTYRIQPNEGIGLELLTKKPGNKFMLDSDYMQFCYKNLISTHYDAYEKLIYDVMLGDPTFFNDSPEIEASWKFIDKYVKGKQKIFLYEQGSWGPEEANKLIEADNRKWIEPSAILCK